METVLTITTILSAANFTWFNPPKKWSINDTTIQVHTDANTDFWRKTHYGFERDTGHFFYTSLAGDQPFNASVIVRGQYNTLYDQGGLMVRIDEQNWIKCGIEYVDGKQHASAVVTVNGWSDWNVVPIENPETFRLRIERETNAVHIYFATNTKDDYTMMRLAYFPLIGRQQPILVGIMCASPNEQTNGFQINFDDLIISGSLYNGSTIKLSTSFVAIFIALLLATFFRSF